MAIMSHTNELKIISYNREKTLEDPEEDIKVKTEKETIVGLFLLACFL